MRDGNGGGENPTWPGESSPWSRWLSWLAVACIFAATFGYGAFRARFGIDAGDEGLYLAAPLRYALGDLPFRDEFFTPHRMFDLVLAPVFYFVPNVSVLELRLGWMTIQFGAMLWVFALFRRFAPDVVVALACSATLWFGNLIWTPGYHLMGTYLFVLALAIWLSACLSERRRVQLALGAASGAVFHLAVMSYLPIAAAGAIPMSVLLVEIARGHWPNGRTTATLGHLGCAGLFAACSVLSLAVAGLVPDWIDAHQTFLSYWSYGAPISVKLALFADQTGSYWPIAAGTTAVVIAMYVGVRRLPAWSRFGRSAGAIASIGLSAVAAWVLHALIHDVEIESLGYFDDPMMVNSLRLVAMVFGLHIGALLIAAAWRRREAGTARSFSLVYTCVVSGSVVLAFLHGVLSTNAYKAMWALLPLTVSGIVVVHRLLFAGARAVLQRALATGFALVLCGVIFEFSHTARRSFVYPGASRYDLTAEFNDPKLSGIRATPAVVATLEKVIEYLSSRVEPGDFLLAYDQIPLIYYLTQTRPALDHAFTSQLTPVELRARSVERMIARGRVPRYAVVTRRLSHPEGPPDPAKAPIHAFVAANYRREAVFQIPGWSTDPLSDPGSRGQIEIAVINPAGIRRPEAPAERR